MPKARVALPEYKPDQSQNSGVLLTAQNVFPAMDGYRAVNDIASVSDAIAGTILGGYSAISSDATAYFLAGTSAKLQRLNADGTWADLLTGLTIEARWKFAQFKNVVITVNEGATQEVDLGAGTASALAGAPSGNDVGVVGDFVVITQADGDISMVQWSAFNDHTGWTPAVDQSGFQPMNTGGAVMGIAGGEYGIILQRSRLVRMTRTGDSSAPFAFDEISPNWGCANSATIAQAGRTVFFYSDRGFMALDDGQELRPIGSEKVDRTFAAAVNRDSLGGMFTAVDPANKLVFWGIPGRPGTLWIYNFELGRWATAVLNFSGILPGYTTSYGLDDLPSLGYTDLDAMTISLDDPRWSGGNPRLYLFGNDDRLGTLAGDNLAATLDLGFSELTPGYRARVRGVRPFWDGVDGMTLTLNGKLRLGDQADRATSGNLRTSGTIPIRKTGRFISTRIEIEAGAVWDYVQALEFEFDAGGQR